ncbi:hypothetical protein CROQUDRAFT_101411 [Cronartium quercuum f. sp. fusiforme G11]|uniref:RING-type domain-containing protein n=1 Tax=Cronartium quercuum f. sp. fusiforme G11 TaxID=708437 RepID=A0A9P6T5N1_9BASI|nr:hypothetical protein CROQUDRAFT_101411 [Cronartium quercuum f. sp. fusiforme G11]
MLTFASSNPETLDLFRSVYYRPKIVLLILLFFAFPSTDTLLHLPRQASTSSSPTSTNNLELTRTEPARSVNSYHLPDTHPSSNAQHPKRTRGHPQPDLTLNPTHSSSIKEDTPTLPCPDAYLDHRNNIICPHAPKRLKSVRQRYAEVLQEVKSTLKRWTDLHPTTDPGISARPLWPTYALPYTATEDRWSVRTALCMPLASPFAHLLLLLHTLFFIQALSLLVEDALVKDACASTLAASAFRSSSSWPKIWSRFRFRLANHWSKRSFWEPFGFWIASLILLGVIASEALGDTGSWQTGGVWHDLPFRNVCQRSSSTGSTSNMQSEKGIEVRVSIIGIPALKLLSFLLDRAPFLKPARTLVLIECVLGLVCLCQPAQHFLPQKIFPKTLRVPNRFLSLPSSTRSSEVSTVIRPPPGPSRNTTVSQRLSGITSGHPRSSLSDKDEAQVVEVEVETKWVLSVLVEACVCVGAIASYVVVMVHLPYTSSYWFPLLLSITYIKSCVARLKNLYHSALHTLRCLESVLSRFGPEPNTRKRDWRCSICFEDEDCSDESDSPPSPTSNNENFKESGERCVVLNCGHRFHARCLVKWLHYQTFCPICHRSVQSNNSQ